MKKDYETMTVGEIVADNFGNAEVFDKYGIDFCCHGSILLPEASQKAGADMDEIIKDIENLAPITTENIDFKNWPLDLLADYILKIHHRNIRKNGPKIQELLEKGTWRKSSCTIQCASVAPAIAFRSQPTPRQGRAGIVSIHLRNGESQTCRCHNP